MLHTSYLPKLGTAYEEVTKSSPSIKNIFLLQIFNL